MAEHMLPQFTKGFPGSSVVKVPPAKQEMKVQSLSQGDPLGKEMASPSSVLACKITMNRGAYSLRDGKRVGSN